MTIVTVFTRQLHGMFVKVGWEAFFATKAQRHEGNAKIKRLDQSAMPEGAHQTSADSCFISGFTFWISSSFHTLPRLLRYFSLAIASVINSKPSK